MRGYAAIGLHNPKTDANVGSALRACGCYGAAFMAVTGNRYSRHGTDTQKHHRQMPLLQVEDLRAVIPYDCVPVAVDLIDGAIELPKFTHPERAFYIFGPEDGTLEGPRWSGYQKVYVRAGCLNLAMAVNVVLYDRSAKAPKH